MNGGPVILLNSFIVCNIFSVDSLGFLIMYNGKLIEWSGTQFKHYIFYKAFPSRINWPPFYSLWQSLLVFNKYLWGLLHFPAPLVDRSLTPWDWLLGQSVMGRDSGHFQTWPQTTVSWKTPAYLFLLKSVTLEAMFSR